MRRPTMFFKWENRYSASHRVISEVRTHIGQPSNIHIYVNYFLLHDSFLVQEILLYVYIVHILYIKTPYNWAIVLLTFKNFLLTPQISLFFYLLSTFRRKFISHIP